MIANYFDYLQTLELIRSTPAGPYLESFARELEALGYSRSTIERYLRTAAHVSRWARDVGVPIHELDASSLERFSLHRQHCRCPRGLRRNRGSDTTSAPPVFLQHLRRLGVVSEPPAETTPPVLEEFGEWMRLHRGASDATVQRYDYQLRDVLAVLGEDSRRYDAASVRTYIQTRARKKGRSATRLSITALRMFLRCEIAKGRYRAGLDRAITPLAGWRLSSIPRYLPAADVDLILATPDPSTPAGCRDHAILLLLARLGLRAGDVVALRLCDVDWDGATIQVAGKSRTATRLPLPQEVGDATLRYLQLGRPPVRTDRIFVTASAPWRALTYRTVSGMVARTINRAGVQAPSKGAHVLRHSAATEMLRQGASLDGISAMLRHRSLDTTAQYAKVDFRLLREIALPWPVVSPCS